MNRLNHNRGFTLVELMVSVIIVSISVVALYYMFLQGHTLMIEQEHRRIAFEKARERLVLEEVKYYSAEEEFFSETESFDDFLVDPDIEQEFEGVPATYTVQKILDDNNVPTVIVIYNWVAFSGRDYEVALVRSFKKRDS